MTKAKDGKAKVTKASPKARVGGVLEATLYKVVDVDVAKEDEAIRAKAKENPKERTKENQNHMERKVRRANK